MSASRQSWPGVRVRVPEGLVDEAEEAACSALADGDLLGIAREADFVDQPTDPEEPAGLTIYLHPEADAEACAGTVREAIWALCDDPAAREACEATLFHQPDADWNAAWRDFFRPVCISRRLAILPAWWDEDDEAARSEITLRIDPGQAFGSGTHPTTRLALALLEQETRPGARVLDFGAGSGILTFAASALGAKTVVSVEADPEAVENFWTNARLNGFDAQADHRIGSVEAVQAHERFDLVVCNILFHRIAPLLADLAETIESNGLLILSGYLTEETEVVRDYLHNIGLAVSHTTSLDEWGALCASASP